MNEEQQKPFSGVCSIIVIDHHQDKADHHPANGDIPPPTRDNGPRSAGHTGHSGHSGHVSATKTLERKSVDRKTRSSGSSKGMSELVDLSAGASRTDYTHQVRSNNRFQIDFSTNSDQPHNTALAKSNRRKVSP